jgi:hypothetical protein
MKSFGIPAALFRRLFPIALLVCSVPLRAQDLEPRAYSVSPLGFNLVGLGYNYTSGDLVFDPTLPVKDASARINAAALGYYRSLDFFGRTANVRVAFPYAWGHLQGTLADQFKELYRSGLADGRAQLSVNLYGAPAMRLPEFAKYRAGTNVFASFTAAFPLGQYSPNKLINIGSNRWSLKPEVAVSHTFGKWMAEVYAGVWFFTTNQRFYPGTSIRKQEPVEAYQAHVIYNFRRGLWASLDGTYYHGGSTNVDGVDKLDTQDASRLGGTVSMAVASNQSVKLQYSKVTSVRIGGKFDTFSFGYAFSWFDK